MIAKVLVSYYPQESGHTVHRIYLEPDFDQADKDLRLLKNEASSIKEWELEETEIYGAHALKNEVSTRKEFNINEHIYIRITEDGWKHLRKNHDADFIKICIESKEERIDGEIWHRLQCHEVFTLFPVITGATLLFHTDIMFDNKDLK